MHFVGSFPVTWVFLAIARCLADVTLSVLPRARPNVTGGYPAVSRDFKGICDEAKPPERNLTRRHMRGIITSACEAFNAQNNDLGIPAGRGGRRVRTPTPRSEARAGGNFPDRAHSFHFNSNGMASKLLDCADIVPSMVDEAISRTSSPTTSSPFRIRNFSMASALERTSRRQYHPAVRKNRCKTSLCQSQIMNQYAR